MKRKTISFKELKRRLDKISNADTKASRLLYYVNNYSITKEQNRDISRYRDGICYSLEEIGSLLNISRERVRQIEQDAIRKFKGLLSGNKFRNLRNELREGIYEEPKEDYNI